MLHNVCCTSRYDGKNKRGRWNKGQSCSIEGNDAVIWMIVGAQLLTQGYFFRCWFSREMQLGMPVFRVSWAACDQHQHLQKYLHHHHQQKQQQQVAEHRQIVHCGYASLTYHGTVLTTGSKQTLQLLICSEHSKFSHAHLKQLFGSITKRLWGSNRHNANLRPSCQQIDVGCKTANFSHRGIVRRSMWCCHTWKQSVHRNHWSSKCWQESYAFVRCLLATTRNKEWPR